MRLIARVVLICGVNLALGGAIFGQLLSSDPIPGLEEVGVTQKLGVTIPLTEIFRNHAGEQRPLDQFLVKGLPVILTFNYADCPQLCNLQLDGLVSSLNSMSLSMGEDFQVVSISVNPEETPASFNAFREHLISSYKSKVSDSGWQFLVGEESAIQAVSSAAGFGYSLDEKTRDFAHSAALILLDQSGVVTRYLGGVAYNPETLRLSLIESANGTIGSLFDQAFLTCFYYDPASGDYAPVALAFTRVGAALTVLLIAGILLRAFRRERLSKA